LHERKYLLKVPLPTWGFDSSRQHLQLSSQLRNLVLIEAGISSWVDEPQADAA